jgi:hypothetical protein
LTPEKNLRHSLPDSVRRCRCPHRHFGGMSLGMSTVDYSAGGPGSIHFERFTACIVVHQRLPALNGPFSLRIRSSVGDWHEPFHSPHLAFRLAKSRAARPHFRGSQGLPTRVAGLSRQSGPSDPSCRSFPAVRAFRPLGLPARGPSGPWAFRPVTGFRPLRTPPKGPRCSCSGAFGPDADALRTVVGDNASPLAGVVAHCWLC